MIEIRVEDEAVRAALQQLSARLIDMTPAMQEIGEALMTSTKDRMLAGRTPEGAPFAPRSQTTLDRYASGRPPVRPRGGPLNRYGNLISGIFPSSGSDFASIGSNAIQAAVMQFGQAQGASGRTSRGGLIPWGNIPARPYLGISAEDRTAITEIVEEWLERAAQ